MLIKRLILFNYLGRTLNPGQMTREEKMMRLQTKKNREDSKLLQDW